MPPVSLALWSFELYSRQSAWTCRSPCFITTLPQTRALPLTSNSKLLSSLSMVMGACAASLFGRGGSGVPTTAVLSGQGGSSGNASESMNVRPAALINEVFGTVLRTILIRMLEHDPRLTLIRTWLTRDLDWRIG